ncbi:MAG: EpsI family protein [Marinicaulis sp.]|nr:EpsI family protein [Marinicaulis sp.]
MTVAAVNPEPVRTDILKSPIALFCVFVFAAIILLHPTAYDMARTWATSSSYTHGFFIAPFAAWMILKKSPMRYDGAKPLPGLLIAIAGGVLWLLGAASGAALFMQIAFVTILIGSVGAIFGRTALIDWAYPLGFLYFMIPFGEALVPYLQTITAHTVVGLMQAFGMDVTLDGYLIDTPSGAFEIAVACAGLKFLIAATVIAAVYSYISFTTWRGRTAFLGFAVFIGVAANGIRAFILVLIATLTDKQFAVGPDHILIGWLFYAAVFGVLFWVGRKYSTHNVAKHMDPPAAAAGSVMNVAPLIAIVVAATLYNSIVINRNIERTAPSVISPLSATGWRILPAPANWAPALDHADANTVTTYSQQQNSVYVASGYFTHDRHGAEIISFDTRAYDGDDWRRHGETSAVIYQFGRSEKMPVELIAGPQRRKMAAVYSYWLGDKVYVDRRAMKLAQMKSKLQGQNPQGGVLIMAAAYRSDPEEAIDVIRSFSAAVEPLAAWRARTLGAK